MASTLLQLPFTHPSPLLYTLPNCKSILNKTQRNVQKIVDAVEKCVWLFPVRVQGRCVCVGCVCVYCYCYELTALFRHDSEVQTRELVPSDCVGKLYSRISKAKLIARLFFLFSISPNQMRIVFHSSELIWCFTVAFVCSCCELLALSRHKDKQNSLWGSKVVSKSKQLEAQISSRCQVVTYLPK